MSSSSSSSSNSNSSYYPVVNDIYYGLLVKPQFSKFLGGWMPLPLSSVDVRAEVFDFCSEVTVTQTYTNETVYNLESEYIFPLDENSAVCGFKAELNGRIINGLVKEKEEAKREFQAAKQAGKSTMLLEQKQENIFKISIGNLNAHTQCKITLTYITTLDLEGKSNRFVVPAVVAPKYEPFRYFGGRTGEEFNNSMRATLTESLAISNGDTMNFFQKMTNEYMGETEKEKSETPAPPVLSAATLSLKQVRTEAQRFTMSIELLMPSEILSITSETHQDQLTITIDPLAAPPNAEGRLTIPQHARVTFGKNADGTEAKPYPETLGAKDFVLKITQKVYLEARAVLEVDPQTGSQAVQLAFCPETIDIMDASSLQVEILFLIDQSGSMEGESIKAVKACLDIFLRSLPVVCKFNLISFGDSHRKLFPSSQLYSEQSIAQALTYVKDIRADLGGTEIMPPLRYCLSEAKDVAYPRQIFLLTDGQVSNVQELIDLTRQYANNARLFTYGLGSGVDRHLVKSLAAAGHGECEFITGHSTPEAKQELNSKIMRNLIKAMQPSLQDIKIDWSGVGGEKIGQVEKSGSAPTGSEFFAAFAGSSSASSSSSAAATSSSSSTAIAGIPAQQCPSEITPIFPPNRELIYALGVRAPIQSTSSSSAAAGDGQDHIVNIRVTAHSNRPNSSDGKSRGQVEWTIPLNLTKIQHGKFIHKLAARARISEIQNWTRSHNYYKDQKREVLKLAIPYQLLSNYTAFIIVDEPSAEEKMKMEKEKEALKNAQLEMFNTFANMQMKGDATAAAVPASGAASSVASQQPPQVYSYMSTPDPVAATPTRYYAAAAASTAPQPRGAPQSGSDSDSSLGCGFDLFGNYGTSPALVATSVDAAKRQRSESEESVGGVMGFSLFDGDEPPGYYQAVAAAAKKSSSAAASSQPKAKECAESDSEEDCGMGFDMFGDYGPSTPAPATAPSVSAVAAPSSSASSSKGGSLASAAESNNLFTSLTQLVAIDGTWQLTNELLTLMKSAVNATGQSAEIKTAVSALTLAGLTTLAKDKLKLQPKAVGTLLALWIFSVCFGQRQSEWMMMVGKSKGTLRSTLGVPIDQIDTITKQIVRV